MCKASNACVSYWLAGPYRTVKPWTFIAEGDNLDGFRLHLAPFHHVGMWTVENEAELTFNESQDCNLYGGIDPKHEYSMEICIGQHAGDILVAGKLL